MKPILRNSLAAAVVVSAALPAAAAERPVVVELFTSQGCSSCPPADAILGELSKMPGLLPLAFHVDYWDRLGWKDPYSSAAATARQRAYAASLGLHTIYTPQMVIDGRIDAIGSDRAAVARGIASAAKQTSPVALRFERSGEALQIGLSPVGDKATGSVWLVTYDRQHTTRIGAGENGGHTLTEYNIVRKFEQVGAWDGTESVLTVPMARLGGAAAASVLVQGPDARILGAGTVDMPMTN